MAGLCTQYAHLACAAADLRVGEVGGRGPTTGLGYEVESVGMQSVLGGDLVLGGYVFGLNGHNIMM